MAIFRKNTFARRLLQAGAVAGALGAGYFVRDIAVAQNAPTTTVPPTQKSPVVSTPATRDASSIQSAFADVAEAVEPAVVTIRTRGARPERVSGPGGAPGGPPGNTPRRFPAPGGGSGDPFEDFQDFFKQFRRDFGQEQNFDPQSWHGRILEDKAREQWKLIQARPDGGLGSGMIYRSDGLIITNAHVVRDADSVTVEMSDGRVIENAKVLGRDDRTDIAVVKIPGSNYATVKLADSDDVRVGDWAIAVGNPFGLDHTLTVGVVSAKSRRVNLAVNRDDTRTDYLQTDASINPGNSGGPLLDIYGRVIGVNNAIYSESGGNQGIGFAIPVNTARFVADRIVKDGRVRRAYLGVNIGTIEREGAAFGLDPNLKGVLIVDVSDPNAPGAKAGLQPGDVVTKFNGQTVTDSSQLQQLVGNAPIGSTATLTVLREGRTIDLKATLAELPDSSARTPVTPNTEEEARGRVQGGTESSIKGLTVREIDAQVKRALDLKVDRGVVVTQVAEGSAAGEAGLQRGDVIERVGQTSVSTIADLNRRIGEILGKQTGTNKKVALFINRGGQRTFVTVTTE